MRLRNLIAALVVLALSATCVRLGFWQLSRWHEKQAANATLRNALARPPLLLRGRLPLDSVRGRRIQADGSFDERRHVLLVGRAHQGAPGVHVVTPLLLKGGGGAVLVDRGWLYAADGASARPQDYPEPGERTVLGIAEPIRQGMGATPLRARTADSVTLYAARWLDFDSLSERFPYTLSPYLLRQLPGGGVASQPLRSAPADFDESMHISYAVQWFVFGATLLGGSGAYLWSRMHRDAALKRAT
jgi:surfeit locus 1 family protein